MKIQLPVYPKSSATYTLEEIVNVLTLRDSPSLMFVYQEKSTAIQDSHMALEDLLTIPRAKESKWQYIRETSEWIPIFRAVDVEKVLLFVDIEKEINPTSSPEELGWWVTPKGYPRKQYYDES